MCWVWTRGPPPPPVRCISPAPPPFRAGVGRLHWQVQGARSHVFGWGNGRNAGAVWAGGVNGGQSARKQCRCVGACGLYAGVVLACACVEGNCRRGCRTRSKRAVPPVTRRERMLMEGCVAYALGGRAVGVAATHPACVKAKAWHRVHACISIRSVQGHSMLSLVDLATRQGCADPTRQQW